MEIRKINAEETWQLRHQVMWPEKPLNFVKLPNDKEGWHYGLFVEDELLSIISLFLNGNRAQFRKFATLTDYQGKGYGSILLKHIVKLLGQKNIKHLWCNARTEKAGFYEKIGFLKTNQTFTKGGKNYIVMDMKIL